MTAGSTHSPLSRLGTRYGFAPDMVSGSSVAKEERGSVEAEEAYRLQIVIVVVVLVVTAVVVTAVLEEAVVVAVVVVAVVVVRRTRAIEVVLITHTPSCCGRTRVRSCCVARIFVACRRQICERRRQ